MKKCKMILGVLLSVVLLFTSVVPTFASSDRCKCGHAPVVSVSGINHVPLVDQFGQQVFAPSMADITLAILNLMPDFLAYLDASNTTDVSKQKSTASQLLYAVAEKLRPVFYKIKCDKNGNSINKGIHIDRFFPNSLDNYNYEVRKPGLVDELSKGLGEKIGGDHVYIFTYDWRLDLETLADQLNDFVENVKKQTGHSKVVMDGQSMGTCLVHAYIAKYGTGSLETVAMLSGAYTGVDMVGEICKGNIDVEAQGVIDLLIQKMEGSADETPEKDITKIKDILEDVIKRISPVLKYDDVKRVAYDKLLTPYFGFIPSLWAFVPLEDFDEAWNWMFANVKPGKELEEKIINYRDSVQKTMDTRVKDLAKSKSVKYYCVSHYNRQMLPLTSDMHLNADGIIETNRTSGGAVVANRGETLPKSYKQKVKYSENMISPDRVIDASTCLAPKYTWFIKGLNHVEYNEESSRFFIWLLTSKKQYDINTNPLYTQFMRYNYKVQYLSPMLHEYGDVNLDGNIDLVDVREALKFSEHPDDKTNKDRASFGRADINGDLIVSAEEVDEIKSKCA